MFSPLMQSIIERESLPVLSAEQLDAYARDAGDLALLVAGDWTRHVEVNDLAVIFPELLNASNGILKGAVLDRESERDIQLRFRFNRFPLLIFLRNGAYLGRIQKVLDWQDYIIEINAILAGETAEPPAYELPEGCGTTPVSEKEAH